MNNVELNNIGLNIKSLIDKSLIVDNMVAIYDIDGTLLTSSYDVSQVQPIVPIIDSYNYALSKCIKPIIITARNGSIENIKATISQLESHGIKNFGIIYFRPIEINDVATYKLLARKNVVDKGFMPLYSVGDMPFDIGMYGGQGFKVPSEEMYVPVIYQNVIEVPA